MSETSTSTRTTIALPSERFAQLTSLAEARQFSAAALVEQWIDDAVEKGEPGAVHPPGYMALNDDGTVFLEIAGHRIPELTSKRAALLAMVLAAAAGVPNPKFEFEIKVGRGIPFDLESEGATLTVGRVGRGVVFLLDRNGEQTKFAAPPSLVANVVRQIWHELKPSN